MTNAKILIVQDAHSAATLKECLEDLGHTVCGAVSTKQQAIEKAHATLPDLALIDLGLGGGVQGIEVAEQMGSQFDLPVVYLTDDAESNLLQRTRTTHPFAYLLKPFDARQLHLNIQTALAWHERERTHRETESRLERTIGELQDRVQFMRSAFDSTGDGVVAVDENGEPLIFNASAQRILGASAPGLAMDQWSQTCGFFLSDRVTPLPHADLPLTRALSGESSENVEVFVRNPTVPDGLMVSMSARSISHNGGRFKGGVLTCRNITESMEHQEVAAQLERTVEDLQEQTQLLETVFQSMGEGIGIADPTGQLLLINESGQEILGMGVVPTGPDDWPEAYGVFDLDQKTQVTPDQLPMVRALRGETVEDVEMYVRHANKPEGAFVSTSARPIKNPDNGQISAAVAIFRDVTQTKKMEAELKKQSRLMETVFNSVSEGVVVTDEKGNFLFSNSSAHDIVGMGEEEGSPDQWAETYGTFHPDRKTPFPSQDLPLMRAMRGEDVDGVELFIRNANRPSGVYISVNARPLQSVMEEFKGGVIVFRDITSLKETEDKLRGTIQDLEKQTHLMETVFNSISDGVVVADAEGKFTIFNPGAERIVGVGMLEVTPDQWTDRYGIFFTDKKTHIPTDQVPLVRAIQGQAVDDMEVFIRNEKRPDGVYLNVSGRPLRKEGAEYGGGVVVFQDITKRKAAETRLAQTMNELRNQNELMETTFNSIKDGIIVADESGEFLYMNPGAELVVGRGMAKLTQSELGKGYGAFYPDRETLIETKDLPLYRAIFQGESSNEEDVFIRSGKKPDGVYIRVSGRPLLDEFDKVRGGVVIFRDVTEQVLAEEALVQAFAQGRLEIVDTILHNIGNATNSVTTGIETICRNLANNPLMGRLSALADAVETHREDWPNYIRNHPQGQRVLPFVLALAKDLVQQQEEFSQTANRVRERAKHIADIVRTQKVLGSSSMSRKDVNLSTTISSAVRVLQDSLAKRAIRVRVDCQNSPRTIRVQESQFHQMMVNLIKNGMEAIDDLDAAGKLDQEPSIQIRAYVEKDYLKIDVTDNGIGLEKENFKRIFNAGYSTKERGSGLGLHSIANFVIGTGGQIQPLSDGFAKGTTMRVMLRLSTLTASIEERE